MSFPCAMSVSCGSLPRDSRVGLQSAFFTCSSKLLNDQCCSRIARTATFGVSSGVKGPRVWMGGAPKTFWGLCRYYFLHVVSRLMIYADGTFCLLGQASQTQEPGTAAYAGDFGFKVLTSSDPAEKTKKLSLGCVKRSFVSELSLCRSNFTRLSSPLRSAELANGRLAMMAIIGMRLSRICVLKLLHAVAFLACFLTTASNARADVVELLVSVEVLPGWFDWQRLG